MLEDAFRAGHGVHSMDEFQPYRRSIFWQCRSPNYELRRTVSRHGVCAADMARKPARHRSDVGRECEQALCDGLAPQCASFHLGGCERLARLANLVGPRRLAYSSRTQALL